MNLFYTVTSEKPLDKEKKYWFDVKLDSGYKYQYEYAIEEGNLIDENTFAGMMTFNIKTQDGTDLPDKFVSNVKVENLHIGFGGENVVKAEDDNLNIAIQNKTTDIKEYTVNEIDGFEEVKIKKYPARLILEYGSGEGRYPFEGLEWKVLDGNKKELKFVMGDEKQGVTIAQYVMPSDNKEIFIKAKDKTVNVQLD